MENNLIKVAYTLSDMLSDSRKYLLSLYPNVHDGVQKELAVLISNLEFVLETRHKPIDLVEFAPVTLETEVKTLAKIQKLEDKVKHLENELQSCENKAKHFGFQRDIYFNKYRVLRNDLRKILNGATDA